MYSNPSSNVRRTLRAGVFAAASTVALSGVTAGQAAAHEVPAAPAAPPVATAPAPAAAAQLGGVQGPAESVTHVVGRGESLSKIAARYGYIAQDGWRRIYDANPSVSNPNVVYAGQQLRVPAASEQLAPRALPVYEAPAAPAARRGGSARAGRSATRAAAPGAPAVAGDGVWDKLAACESGGNWSINTGNG